MKQFVMNLMICGVALFLCSSHTRAEPYTLSYKAWLILIMELTEEANHPSDL